MSEPMSDERLEQIRKTCEVERLREAPTITDEMVERGAEACYLASDEKPV